MVYIPLSTYRLQLFHGFTFNDAIDVIGYLSDLGIGHVYTSPYLQASPGSTHGYDVVDHNRINEELGGAEAHQRFCKTIQEYGMGHILDIVPNHMAITGGENAWWWDVLENGPSSQYAAYFDVDWTTRENRFANKILLPILGNHYGRVLEAGELTITREDEMFQVRYYEHVLPIDPRTIHGILSQTAAITFNDELAFMANAFKNLPLPTATDRESTRQRHRDKEILKKLLKRFFEDNPEISATVDSVLNQVNTDPNALDEILEGQNYRLAYWRMAGSDLGYRRFFDINSLVGLKVEDETVFEDTHRLIFRLLEDGLLDGIRIDHPDGLYNPEQYLQRIRQTAPNAWVILEKILHPGEELRASWPVQGTVGYDFLNTVNRLFLHADGKEPLTD
ncbi:malto-oligosyltrehalose synthase, partial [bacterium]|nr:malto-oligosyltrehalose synthase [bacterium]